MGTYTFNPRGFKNSLRDSKIDDNTIKKIQKYLDRKLTTYANKLKVALDEGHKELFREGVMAWFNRNGGISTGQNLYDATVFTTSVTKERKQGGNIYITSTARVDPVKYEKLINKSEGDQYNIFKWEKRKKEEGKFDGYPNGINSGAEFILDLQWNKGILGLPEKSSDGDWVNPKPHIFKPLYDYLVGGFGATRQYDSGKKAVKGTGYYGYMRRIITQRLKKVSF